VTQRSSTNHHDNSAGVRPLAAIILAAGKGTRMNSDLPKVAHPVAGKPIVWWVVNACRRSGTSKLVLVIGYGADVVRNIFAGGPASLRDARDDRDITYAVQAEQRGTGHATLCAESALAGFDGDVLVLAGDGPLLRPSTIATMLKRHRETSAAATMATSVIPDPTGYGRIVRDASGRFAAIVEHRNATEAQRRIREVYPSYACFDARALFEMLHQLKPNPQSGEFYLTDVFSMLCERGQRVEVVDAVPPEDVLSINTPQELATVDEILRRRLASEGRSMMQEAAR
jgi:bifunctional UDP-N-acetylglucosamine pyrophosphorylase/glucosamine-1-phosphate N-acetyltransferase